jgi:hypothetical protein
MTLAKANPGSIWSKGRGRAATWCLQIGGPARKSDPTILRQSLPDKKQFAPVEQPIAGNIPRSAHVDRWRLRFASVLVTSNDKARGVWQALVVFGTSFTEGAVRLAGTGTFPFGVAYAIGLKRPDV